MFQPSRRQFLKSSAALTAAVAFSAPTTLLAAGPAASAHSNKGKIFKSNKGGKIGKTRAEMVKKLREHKELGFDGLEGESPGIDMAELVEAIKEAEFPVHGLVDSVHWTQRVSDPDPKVREIGRAALEQALLDAKQVGATSVLLVPGKVTGPEETHDDVWKRSIVEIRKVLPVAEQQQIKILIENVWNGFCETPEQYRDYIDEINHPLVGAYFDIGNVRRFGKPEEWIVILGPRIGKLDVKDWSRKQYESGKSGFCRLGEGDVDWPAVRAALKQIGYTGWATREGREDKSLADTAELMNQLLDL
ncbi:TIM barrel protein [Planctomicrobium sp. SH664]|uniref:TIM barrel protein n=1 Tax=Planctomicrobium sp. SH664 TaxID=3448125 RepID=UPI003F5C6A6E